MTATTGEVEMKPMSLWRHFLAYVSLGLLCGWFYFICMFLYPLLIIQSLRGSILAATIFAFFIFLAYAPIKYEAWEAFMYSSLFDLWKEYFAFSYDKENLKGNIKEGEKYFFFQFPHGAFPIGEIVSASVVREITPGTMICGSGADVIFSFPILRHFLAWIAVRPARKEYYTKTFQEGNYAAVIPGGIAEMYLIDNDSNTTEKIYFQNRKGTVKLAIQNGANIVPVFFFGHTKLFKVFGGDNKWLAGLSRRLKMSILFFYGRNYLPVPFRHPLRMVFGEVVPVQQKENPTEEDINEVMKRVIKGIEDTYEKKRPDWETRKLVIL
jgi:1-acyl-sn-glycerol-3-phosphate acyltransferase